VNECGSVVPVNTMLVISKMSLSSQSLELMLRDRQQPTIVGLSALSAQIGYIINDKFSFFRLDALALSVIATATWLAGWLGGWLSVTAGIVSKRLNVSENFFDHLIAPS